MERGYCRRRSRLSIVGFMIALGLACASPATAAGPNVDLRGATAFETLANINRYVNAQPWQSDRERYGRRDHWASPAEFWAAPAGGDCEDYARAKQALLRAHGLPGGEIVTFLSREVGRVHAVLRVPLDGELWTLDNLKPTIEPWRTGPLFIVIKVVP